VDEGRGFTIIYYEDRYKQALEDISLPWLLEYDLLEPVDLEMLAEPHRFLSGGGRVLLARWGEEIVGMVMLELQGKGQCELLKFGVKEAYRGRGIGTALMEAALQAARDAGQKKAVLTSNHQLREALRLYERFGFKYVTYSDKWFQLSDIRMERAVGGRIQKKNPPPRRPGGGRGYFLQRGHSVRENWVTSLIHSRERRRYRPMPNLTNCSAMMPI